MKITVLALAAGLCAAALGALPLVDGKAAPGEYGSSMGFFDGASTVYWQADGKGGLYIAVAAATTGWVGIGLGSVVMDGAHIYMGYVKDGVPVFSEQVGDGHGHHAAAAPTADDSAVGQKGGVTTIELHLPAAAVPRPPDGKLHFIAAFSGAADLATYHEDNRDSGTIDLGGG
jgi:hypothetical protein